MLISYWFNQVLFSAYFILLICSSADGVRWKASSWIVVLGLDKSALQPGESYTVTRAFTVPLFLPLFLAFKTDLVWLGVITTIAVEVGLLTPSFRRGSVRDQGHTR